MNRVHGNDLTAGQAYGLLRLRAAVFVVEQECPYQDLDGRDLAADTLHLWEGPDGEPQACVRVLRESPTCARIGRVCVAPTARRAGLATVLMRRALTEIGTQDCVLDAQSYLAEWYRTFGFEPTGPEFLEDGIPHTPMRRAPGAS